LQGLNIRKAEKFTDFQRSCIDFNAYFHDSLFQWVNELQDEGD
jgi:hypothetical protein